MIDLASVSARARCLLSPCFWMMNWYNEIASSALEPVDQREYTLHVELLCYCDRIAIGIRRRRRRIERISKAMRSWHRTHAHTPYIRGKLKVQTKEMQLCVANLERNEIQWCWWCVDAFIVNMFCSQRVKRQSNNVDGNGNRANRAMTAEIHIHLQRVQMRVHGDGRVICVWWFKH